MRINLPRKFLKDLTYVINGFVLNKIAYISKHGWVKFKDYDISYSFRKENQNNTSKYFRIYYICA